MGGTFTVKVTVVLKNGAKMTAEKEFTVNTYSMVAEPDEFQRDATTTITVTVTGRDGKPVNNAYVAFMMTRGTSYQGRSWMEVFHRFTLIMVSIRLRLMLTH